MDKRGKFLIFEFIEMFFERYKLSFLIHKLAWRQLLQTISADKALGRNWKKRNIISYQEKLTIYIDREG